MSRSRYTRALIERSELNSERILDHVYDVLVELSARQDTIVGCLLWMMTPDKEEFSAAIKEWRIRLEQIAKP